jgi:putative oxidoreductase
MSATGLFVLRIALALVSIAHGAHMLFGTMGGPGSGLGQGGLTASAAQFAAMGLPGTPLALVVGVAQLAGGLLLAVGYLTRPAALTLAALTAILAWKSQAQWGFFLNWVGDAGRGHGIEYSLVLTAGFVCLALTGGGEYSLEGRRAKRVSHAAAGRARLRRT